MLKVRSKRHFFTRVIVYFLALICILICLFLGYSSYVRSNIQALNDNHHAVSKYINASSSAFTKYHSVMIFYRSSCSHCRHVIPYIYTLNKLMGHHKPLYVDVDNPTSAQLGSDSNNDNATNNVPAARKFSADHGDIYWRKVPLLQTNAKDFASKFVLIFLTIFIVSILGAIVF